MSFTIKKAPKEHYVLDNIGNRLSTTNSTSTNDYTANSLNQYSDIDGTNLTYDADGNMLSKGVWTYTWNGENRLISASNGATVVTMAYDYMGRRFEKAASGDTTIFVYDGWNMVRESSSTETNHYVWGLDVFGTQWRGGGVGGLLSVTENDGEVYLPVADANGNITGYIDDSGIVEAVYTYNAFGGVLASSGAKADDFKFRFSSKYQDETGLNYYGYRHYDAEMGRWLNRDPIGEYAFFIKYTHSMSRSAKVTLLPRLHGTGAYRLIDNNAVNYIDSKGLMSGLTEMICGCMIGPIDAAAAAIITKMGATIAKSKYPIVPPERFEPPEANAYRHCIASCVMTRNLGRTQTAWVQLCHEEFAEGGTPADRRTDEHNNEIGNDLGELTTTKSCTELCDGAMPPNGPPTLRL